LNSHVYLVFDNGNGIGYFNLRLVDIDTGKITKFWDGSFLDYQADPSGNWLVVTALPEGLQLINLKTLQQFQHPDSLPNPPNTFLRVEDGKIVALPKPAKPDDEMISVSPDLRYWAVAIDKDIKIYSSDIILIKDVSVPSQDAKFTNIQWNPDSSSLFLVYGTNIYSLNISSGDVSLVETNLINNYDSTYKWVNDQ